MRIQDHKNILLLALLALGVFLALPVCAQSASAVRGAQNAGDPDAENPNLSRALRNYINQARKDPLAMAEAIGMKREQVLADLPELGKILEKGLPPLRPDERLQQTAFAHSRDMQENTYYDYAGPDGAGFEQRIQEAGYLAGPAGESLGILFFNNFIPGDRAVFELFADIYRDELDSSRQGERNILNPAMKHIGVSVYAGQFRFNGFSGNVYLATCDFAAPLEMKVYERQILQLINQARANPRAVADYYGLDLEGFPAARPESEAGMEKALPPLVFDRGLYAAAKEHARDMMERDYLDAVSVDNTTPEIRAKENGYHPAWIAESRYRLPTYDKVVAPGKTPARLFQKMFSLAVKPGAKRQYRHMLAAEPSEAGVRVISGKAAGIGGIVGDCLQLSVVEYAAPVVAEAPGIAGVVYVDKNGSGLYDPGEGVSGAKLGAGRSGRLPEEIFYLQTDSAGGFSFSGKPGVYRLVLYAEGDEKPLSRQVELGSGNRWLAIRLSP